jgi:hypothetical protein
MYRVVPSPLGGVWLQTENGVVVASGENVHSLKAYMRMAMERREFSPFVYLYDEFGSRVQFKEYVKN